MSFVIIDRVGRAQKTIGIVLDMCESGKEERLRIYRSSIRPR